jgi:hypothetical protein
VGEREAVSEARALLVAATRKVAVTVYHSQQLQNALPNSPAQIDAVQAHFEGVFYAGTAATEKTAAAISVSLDGISEQDPDPNIGRAIERLKEHSAPDHRELEGRLRSEISAGSAFYEQPVLVPQSRHV